MNILELDSYDLSDAVKFNEHLNPALWTGTTMRPEVREQLLKIAADFKESLGLDDLSVKDITVSGSNAGYTYTPHSDIDLHLVVDIPQADSDEVYRELFDAKKFQYNEQHTIKIRGYDVELYVENANKPPVSKGVYSVLHGDWVQIPKKRKSEINDDAVRSKFEDLGHRIESAIKTQDFEKISSLAEKIKNLRQAGLDEHGELGPENLAYKMLRSQGMIKKLYNARTAARDQELSLKERNKIRAPIVYGFKTEDLDSDGVMMTKPTNCSSEAAVPESKPNDEDILKDFIEFCVKELKIDSMPIIKLRKDPQWSKVHKTFGRYTNGKNLLEVAWGQRHIMDVLRTVAHELTHKHQHERDGDRMGPDAGETGSPWENEANARAGILMRDYGRLHPEYFEAGQAEHLHGDEVTESASGYIPTKKQAKDPRYSMALTKDIKPGQVGKEANKLGLETDSQGHPALLMKNLANALESYKQTGEFIVENDQLDEVKMSPGALKKFAASPEARGIMAGFEAELIFRDTQGDDDSDDYEADYDADERCYSIDQVVEFFENDDYGYGLSSQRANRLRNDLDERYYEWWDEQMYSAFRDEQDDLIRDLLLEDKSMDERVHDALTQGHDYSDEEADKIIAAGGKAPRFTKLDDQEIYAEQNPDYEAYLQATEDAEAILEEEVQASVDNQDSTYDQAVENFRDSFQVDDSSFFSDVGLRWMSSVASDYDLDWPIMTGGGGNGGSREWSDIAHDLEQVTGKKVVVGSSYHSARRKPNEYVLEPDSSLSPDDREDYGLELVSPPMPLDEAIEQLNAIVDWANSAGDAYTNSSTGLHMGVSIPYKGGDVDYLKLMLFLGDQYVLEKFGRSANTYCDSAMKKLKQNVAGSKNRGDDKIASAMELMKHGLIELAQKYVQQGVGNSKYTSAHIKPGYIEFRSPGGDYLSQADRGDITDLEDTMRRFAYAMYLAGRPDLERKEYYKKLYKLIAPEGNKDLELFSKFSSGEITAEELKKQWAEKVIAKEVPATGKEKGQWILYNNDTQKPVPGMKFGNYTEIDALERAKAKVSPASSMEDFKKAYTLVDDSKNTGVWDVVETGTEKVIATIEAPTRGEAADEAYDRQYDEDWYVRPHVEFAPQDKPEPKLSRRAQLAKQIAKPTDYVIINKHSGLPFYTFRASSNSQAVDFGVTYLRDKGLDVENFSVQKASNVKQSIDNAVDSKQLQQRLTPANYEFVYEPTGRVLDQVNDITSIQANAVLADVRRRYNDLPADSIVMREREPQVRDIPITVDQDADPEAQIRDVLAAQRNQVRMPNGVPVWELVDKDTNHPVWTIADHNAREAWNQALGWLRSVGAEDPSTYQERFTIRPKQLQAGERNNPPLQTPMPRGDFEVYQHDTPDEVFTTLRNVTADEIRNYIQQQEAGGMPPGFLRVRQLTESTDPEYEGRLKELIATLDKNLNMLAVAKDPKLRDLYYKFKNQKKQAEKKLVKLNSPISEMHDKAQEARDAMDQAARKMGYKDFASVPASARNSIMRMAIEILNMTGKPDHHKQFG